MKSYVGTRHNKLFIENDKEELKTVFELCILTDEPKYHHVADEDKLARIREIIEQRFMIGEDGIDNMIQTLLLLKEEIKSDKK